MITAGDFYKWLKIFKVLTGTGGAIVFKGTWNAATNTPTLASGVGNSGDLYIVSVAGSTNLDGITDWQPGDWAVFNGTVWQKVDNTQGNYVVGPTIATDSAIPLFDGTTGKLVKDSAVLLSALQPHSTFLDSLAAQTSAAGKIILSVEGSVFNRSAGALPAMSVGTPTDNGTFYGFYNSVPTFSAAIGIENSAGIGVLGTGGAYSLSLVTKTTTGQIGFGVNNTLTTVLDTAGRWLMGYTTNQTGAKLQVNGNIFTSGTFNGSLGATIPSAATLNLQTATGGFLTVSGTTPVTAITLSPGSQREVIFSGVLTLTANALIILPFNGASIVTAPGDTATFYGTTSGIVICTNYQRADGTALVSGGSGTVTEITSTPADGVTLNITDSTTTPNITPSLGDITPNSVTVTHTINSALGDTIPSDATINLTTATGNFLTVSGSTEISQIILAPGYEREIIFDGSPNLVHSQIILPTGANVIVKPGDRMRVIGTTDDDVIVTKYQRFDGSPLSLGTVREADAGLGITLNGTQYNNYILTLSEPNSDITFTPWVAGIATWMMITLINNGIDEHTVNWIGVTFAGNFIPVITPGADAQTFVRADWNGITWVLSQIGDVGSTDVLTPLSITFQDNGVLRGGIADLDAFLFEVYNSTTVAYEQFLRAVSSNNPQVYINAPNGGRMYVSDLSYLSKRVLQVTAGATLELDTLEDQSFEITLTEDLVITIPDGVEAQAEELVIKIINGGAFLVSWANTEFAALVAPTIAQGSGAETFLNVYWDGTKNTLFAPYQPSSSIDSESVPPESAVPLTSNVFETVTSITVAGGSSYKLSGCIVHTGEGIAIVADEIFGAIGTADGDSSDGIDFSNIWVNTALPTVEGDVGGTIPTTIVSPSVDTEYFLKAFVKNAVGVDKAYGSIMAEKI